MIGKKIQSLFVVALVAAAFTACDNTEKSTVTADMVTNPKTANEGQAEELKTMPEMQFDTLLHDFGNITQGERVKTTFSFTNSGEADLIITNAKGSCGCTVPDWPKRPIKPGETAEIKVMFNSEGRQNTFHKQIYITANTDPATNVLAIKGNILTPSTNE